jgi:tetratricopeptide (TPR) repeat protein
MKKLIYFILTFLPMLALTTMLSLPTYAEDPGAQEVYKPSPAAQLLQKLSMEYYQNSASMDFTDKEQLFKMTVSISDKVIAAYPEDPLGYSMKAQGLAESGKGDEALELADKVAALTPGKQDGAQLKVVILSRMGRRDDALALADQVIEADPKAEGMYTWKINELSTMKKLDEALVVTDKLIQNNPESKYAYNEKFCLLRELKRYPEALAVADKMIEKDPNMAFLKMQVLKEMGNNDDALAAADTMIASNPSSEQPYIQKAELLQEAKRYDEALAVLEKAIEIKPDSQQLYSQEMYLLKKMMRYDDAIGVADKIIGLAPDNAESYSAKIEVLKEAGRFEDVPAVMAEVVKLNPKTAQDYYNKAMTLERLNRYDDAAAAYDKGMALGATSKTAGFGLQANFMVGPKVKCLIKGVRYEEALSICESNSSNKALGLEIYKAVALEKLGRHDEAVKIVKKVKNQNFSGEYTLDELGCPALELALVESKLTKTAKRRDWDSYGEALVKVERYEDAVAAFDKALKMKPSKDPSKDPLEEPADYSRSDSEIIGSKAGALLRLGRYDEAVAGFRVYAKDHGDCGCSKMSLAFALKMRGAAGDKEEAAKLLQEVVDKGEKDVRTAMAYALLGERSKMLNLVAWLVKVDPAKKRELRKDIEFGDYRNDDSFIALVND